MPELTISPESTDSIVFSIVSQFIKRSEIGKSKYGTTLDRTDLSVLEWIQHAQEEHMDAILYLEKLKPELTNKEISYSAISSSFSSSSRVALVAVVVATLVVITSFSMFIFLTTSLLIFWFCNQYINVLGKMATLFIYVR